MTLASLIILFEIGHLIWEHNTGGVLSHHLLNRSDFPAVSNWWGIIILPALAWFCTTRVKHRFRFQDGQTSTGGNIPTSIWIGFFGMLAVSLLQSAAFVFGYEDILMYIALFVLIAALFLPLYRAECFLGYVLGATFTFGPVIPILGFTFISIASAVSNLVVKPLFRRFWHYFNRTESQ